MVTSPKENIPTPALVYLDSWTFLQFCTVCCCFSCLLSLNQYLCINTSFVVRLFWFCFLFKFRRKVYIVWFPFRELVVKQCVSNMSLLMSLWDLMLFSAVGILACWLGNATECASVTLSSSRDGCYWSCKQWFLFLPRKCWHQGELTGFLQEDIKSRPYSEFPFLSYWKTTWLCKTLLSEIKRHCINQSFLLTVFPINCPIKLFAFFHRMRGCNTEV